MYANKTRILDRLTITIIFITLYFIATINTIASIPHLRFSYIHFFYAGGREKTRKIKGFLLCSHDEIFTFPGKELPSMKLITGTSFFFKEEIKFGKGGGEIEKNRIQAFKITLSMKNQVANYFRIKSLRNG